MKNPFVIIYLMLLVMFLGKETQAQTTPNNQENSNIELLSSQKRNLLKVDFLAPFAHHLDFSFERVITPRTSFHLTIGLANVEILDKRTTSLTSTEEKNNLITKPTGLFIETGYRFYQFDLQQQRNPNILKGIYLEPSLLIGRYSEYNEGQNSSFSKKVNYQAFLLKGGYQAILLKRLSIDFHLGFGVANDNLEKYDGKGWIYFGEFHQGLYKPDGGLTWGLDGGIKLGFAF